MLKKTVSRPWALELEGLTEASNRVDTRGTASCHTAFTLSPLVFHVSVCEVR
jgi:hypothetical protein